LHEVKHDRYRIVGGNGGERVTLWTRRGTNFTDRLPNVAEAVGSLPAENALIDGGGSAQSGSH
jgi:bifunctional non-homologous end joining protein LigD